MMRVKIAIALLASAVVAGCWLSSGSGGGGDGGADADGDADADSDADGDGDGDADADGDTDADSDADSDGDGDSDTSVIEPGWNIDWYATEHKLFGIWGLSDDEMLVTGDTYLAKRVNGQWEEQECGGDFFFQGYDIWFSDINEFFVGFFSGALYWENETGWHFQALENDPVYVWGFDSDEVYVSAGTSPIMFYDGDSLSELPAQPPGPPQGPTYYRAIWGSDSSDIFVGTQDYYAEDTDPDSKYDIWHYDGQQWSSLGCDVCSATAMDIWGSSSGDVFVVQGAWFGGWGGRILHYDGAQWEEMDIPTTADLYGIWGFGPDDVYAVGWWGTILHYDGEQWTQMDSGTDIHLWDVWGASPDSVWAVGGTASPRQSVILHYTAP